MVWVFSSIIFYIIFALTIFEYPQFFVHNRKYGNADLHIDEFGKFTGFFNTENNTLFFVLFAISIIIFFVLIKLNGTKKKSDSAVSSLYKKDNFSIAGNLIMRDMHGKPFNEKQESFSILDRLFLKNKEPWNYQRKDSVGMLQFLLADAIAIFGLLLFLLNGELNQVFLFSGLAIAAMVLVYPR